MPLTTPVEAIAALNSALDTIDALNRSIDILTQWQDDALEVDPGMHDRILYLREWRKNVDNTKL